MKFFVWTSPLNAQFVLHFNNLLFITEIIFFDYLYL